MLIKQLPNNNFSLNNLSLDRGCFGIMELKRPDHSMNRVKQSSQEKTRAQNILLFRKLNMVEPTNFSTQRSEKEKWKRAYQSAVEHPESKGNSAYARETPQTNEYAVQSDLVVNSTIKSGQFKNLSNLQSDINSLRFSYQQKKQKSTEDRDNNFVIQKQAIANSAQGPFQLRGSNFNRKFILKQNQANLQKLLNAGNVNKTQLHQQLLRNINYSVQMEKNLQKLYKMEVFEEKQQQTNLTAINKTLYSSKENTNFTNSSQEDVLEPQGFYLTGVNNFNFHAQKTHHFPSSTAQYNSTNTSSSENIHHDPRKRSSQQKIIMIEDSGREVQSGAGWGEPKNNFISQDSGRKKLNTNQTDLNNGKLITPKRRQVYCKYSDKFRDQKENTFEYLSSDLQKLSKILQNQNLFCTAQLNPRHHSNEREKDQIYQRRANTARFTQDLSGCAVKFSYSKPKRSTQFPKPNTSFSSSFRASKRAPINIDQSDSEVLQQSSNPLYSIRETPEQKKRSTFGGDFMQFSRTTESSPVGNLSKTCFQLDPMIVQQFEKGTDLTGEKSRGKISFTLNSFARKITSQENIIKENDQIPVNTSNDGKYLIPIHHNLPPSQPSSVHSQRSLYGFRKENLSSPRFPLKEAQNTAQLYNPAKHNTQLPNSKTLHVSEIKRVESQKSHSLKPEIDLSHHQTNINNQITFQKRSESVDQVQALINNLNLSNRFNQIKNMLKPPRQSLQYQNFSNLKKKVKFEDASNSLE